MIQTKYVNFSEDGTIIQGTLRRIEQISRVPCLYEQNIIEFNTKDREYFQTTIKNILLFSKYEEKCVYEITNSKIFENSASSPLDLINHMTPRIIHTLKKWDYQLIFITITEETNRRKLLDFLRNECLAFKLILIINQSTESILPIIQKNLTNTQSIVNVVGYREYYDENFDLIDQIYKVIKYRIMI